MTESDEGVRMGRAGEREKGGEEREGKGDGRKRWALMGPNAE